jgi:glycosyltransferase involved in cell wall biosynthesis
MACGCCAVASRVGGNPELVGDSERGLLFESRNATELAAILSMLLASPERRARLAEAGTRFIRDGFSLATSVTRMQAIYESFVPLSHEVR